MEIHLAITNTTHNRNKKKRGNIRCHTCVRAGYEGELALVLMSVQALQGADHLTTLRCVHTTYLQTGQVITHVPVIKDKKQYQRHKFGNDE